jgi:DNA-binding beta-propeller fold protein YncE
VTTVTAAGPLVSPSGVATDTAGNLYISDTGNRRVRKLSAAGVVSTFASFDTPIGLALDAAGSLYVADAGSSRVFKVSPSGVVAPVAGSGVRGFDGDGGPALQAQFDRPRGVAVDAAGNLFIADTGNNRVRMVDLTGVVTTVMTGLNGPCGVAADAFGAIYAADTGFHRIRKVVPGSNPYTIAGTAEEGYNGEAGAALDLQMSFPSALLFDAAGNLLVTDTGNNRLRLVTRTEETPAIAEPVLQVRILHAATGQEGPFAPGQLVIVDGLPMAPDIVVSWDDVPVQPISTGASAIRLQIPPATASQATTQLRIGNFTREVALISAAPGLFRAEAGNGQAFVQFFP